jgi:predicted N-acyltransferase
VTAPLIDVETTSRLPPAAHWNALSGTDSFYLSHNWLTFAARGTNVRYLTVSAGGDLLGALPLYPTAGESNDDYRVDHVLGGRFAGLPTLAGTRRGYVNELLLHPALDEQRTDVVLEAMVATIHAENAALLYLTTPAAAALMRVDSGLCPLLLSADTSIPLPDGGFAAYLGGLGARRAYTVRKEMRIFHEAGYETAVVSLGDIWQEAAPLVLNVQHRYGHDESIEECRQSLRAQADALGRHSVVFTARHEGALVALSLGYVWRDTLHARFVGFDYDALRDAREYFSILFYEPLRWATENGLRQLHLGRESYQAKLLRGARARPMWAVAPTPVPDWHRRNSDTLAAWSHWAPPELGIPASWLADT